MRVGGGGEASFDSRPANIPESNETSVELSKSEYGPWMMVSRRRGRGGGRGGAGGLGGLG